MEVAMPDVEKAHRQARAVILGSNCEIHSADGRSYIENVSPSCWEVHFNGKFHSRWLTRKAARTAIRALKIACAASEMGFYPLLPKDKLDAICSKLHLDPNDDDLVKVLVGLGWQFNHVDDEYISPDKPEGRWRIIAGDDPDII